MTHARGFPGWGPPTLCGAVGAVLEVCGEIDCEACVNILCGGEALVARIEALEAELGKPTAPPTLRLVRGGAA